MKIKIGEIKQLIHSVLKESVVDEPNYQLTQYLLEDYDIDGRFFNVILNFDSEGGTDGIDIIRVVETFDPDADSHLGGPPEEIKELHLLNQLPKGWSFSNGLLEQQILTTDFLKLLTLSGKLNDLYDKLYEIAKQNVKDAREDW